MRSIHCAGGSLTRRRSGFSLSCMIWKKHDELCIKSKDRLFELCLQALFRLGHHNWWTAWLQWEISVKCLFQGHNDALPVGESNRESATFRSPARRSATELSMPIICCHCVWFPAACQPSSVLQLGLLFMWSIRQVMKFGLNGSTEPALVLGERMVPGSDKHHFCKPADVAVAADGKWLLLPILC